jgi:predicted Zn finger-like uncharacterized protein
VLTQCPNCDTTFRVTSEILRVAQGQVRCGRCDTQFDALERLIQEDELAEEDPDATAEVNQLDDADMQLSEPDLDAEESQFEDEEQEQEQEEEAQAEEWVEFDDIEAQSSLPGEIEEEPVEEELVEEDEEAAELADAAVDYDEDQLEQDEDEAAVAAARGGSASRSFTSERRSSLQALSARSTPRFEDTDQFEINRRPLRIPSLPFWNYLVAPLVVLFAFQVFNHYRAPLARHPRFGGVVSGIYRLLGVDLVPDWNLRAYELKSYRVATDPSTPGTLRVRATVRNSALFPQPYPLLKLILLDRFTEPVRAREFEPIEYLDKPPRPNALLGPRNEFTANFTIVDPGPDAPGFRFDICLRGNNGPVCIDDLPVQMASK